jgi:hypothetical protein
MKGCYTENSVEFGKLVVGFFFGYIGQEEFMIGVQFLCFAD